MHCGATTPNVTTDDRPRAISVVAFAVQLVALPCLGTGVRVVPRTLFTIVKLPVPRVGLLAASAIFFANFAAYTYLNPLLEQRAGLTGEQVTLVLLAFGAAGGVANFTAGRGPCVTTSEPPCSGLVPSCALLRS